MTAQEELSRRISRDGICRAVQKKIDEGRADFTDTARYTDRAAELLGEVLAAYVPDMPPEERETLCKGLLRQRYTDTNAMLNAVQRVLDAAQGLHLAPQIADYPEERVNQAAHALADETVPVETIVRRAKSAPATIARSFQDDYIEKNAAFRDSAGLKCYINRIAAGGCCKWCTAMAGRYRYGEEPQDVYRRHDNCSCTVTYESGRQRQDVWSKRTWEVPGKDAGTGEPVRFSKSQSAELANKNALESLTNNAERDKIKSEYTPATQEEIQQFIESMESLGFTSVTGFEQFTERASLLQEITEDFKKVHADFPEVFPSIHLSFGELDKDVYAQYNTETKILVLNSLFYNDLDYYISDYNREVGKKFHPEGTDYRATVYHEMGHAVEDFYKIHLKRFAQQLYLETHNGFFNRKLGDNWIENGLSIYASLGHYGDFIAEAIGEYYNSKSPRELCKLVYNNIMEIRRNAI